MTSSTAVVHTEPPDSIPIFPIPALSIPKLQALGAVGLEKFYELNRQEFVMLVSVVYVGFLEQTSGMRKKKPSPEKLYKVFSASIQMVLTAASSRERSLRIKMQQEPGSNGLALEFLWNHMRKEKVFTWQDFYADDGDKAPKADGLVKDFVHFLIANAFRDGATTYISDDSRMLEARRVVEAINRGKQKLRAV